MSNYKIEDGISLPADNDRKALKYPFNKMEIRQSFLVPLVEDPTGMRVRTAASAYHKRHPNYRFRVAAIGSAGWRVWRVPATVVVDDDEDSQAEYERKKEALLAEMRAQKEVAT